MKDRQRRIPELRFPGFSRKWELKKLQDYLSFKNGINASKEDYGKGYKFINVLDIINNEYIIHDKIIGQVDISEDIFKKNIVEYGDILFQRSSETREEVGQSNVYLDKEKKATFGGFVIRGKKFENYNPSFMNYLLKTSNSRKEITSKSGGSTRYNVGQETLKEVKIYTTLIPEQQKIASFLTSIDQKLTQLERKKTLLEQYKKGVMQQLFSQKIRFKPALSEVEGDENGKPYPDWKKEEFNDVYKSIPTKQYQIKNAEILEKGKLRVVDQGQNHIAGFSNEIKKVFSNIPVIIYGDHTTVVKYIDFDFVIGADGTKILKSKNSEYNLKYLFYYLQFNNVKPEGYKRHFSIVKKISIEIPVLEEQTKIAAFLSGIDEKIALVNTQLENTRQFKKGLLQQLFV